MTQKLANEYRLFLSHPWNMRVLLVTNMIYALVLPVVEMFTGAYVMRNADDFERKMTLVMTYQLAVYTGIPFTFLVNGFLLKRVPIQWLYTTGMLLSGVSMTVLMSLGKLDLVGVGITGLVMGMSFGFFWANRDFLALSSTHDDNRNYYYGLETFFFILTGITVPFLAGGFIDLHKLGWLGGNANHFYQIITAVVFGLTVLAASVVFRGRFNNPPPSRFLFFKFHALWWRMQLLALLKGLAQGYFVTLPAMLTMRFFGNEGALGSLQSISGLVAAVTLYLIGRLTQPRHRIVVFSVALTFFFLGGVANACWFNQLGVAAFALCMALARPMHDIAYFPIQMRVIDTVSAIERRNQFTYIFNQEFGFYIGRFSGCGLFLLLAHYLSDTFALRYSLLVIGAVQLLSILVARGILRGCDRHAPKPAASQPLCPVG